MWPVSLSLAMYLFYFLRFRVSFSECVLVMFLFYLWVLSRLRFSISLSPPFLCSFHPLFQPFSISPLLLSLSFVRFFFPSFLFSFCNGK